MIGYRAVAAAYAVVVLLLKVIKMENNVKKTIVGDRSIAFAVEPQAVSAAIRKAVIALSDRRLIAPEIIEWDTETRLIYVTGDYIRLSIRLGSMTADEFSVFLSSAFGVADLILQNGRLSSASLVLDPDAIYVDAHSSEGRFVFLPLTTDTVVTPAQFYSNLRSKATEWMEHLPAQSANRMLRIRQMLNDNHITNEVIKAELHAHANGTGGMPGFPANHPGASPSGVAEPEQEKEVLVLRCRERPGLVFRASSFPYHIGREAPTNEGRFPNDQEYRRVGRKHCVIEKEGSRYYIHDLGSRNRTFVNDKVIPTLTKSVIQAGDVLRVAFYSFDVTIERR